MKLRVLSVRTKLNVVDIYIVNGTFWCKHQILGLCFVSTSVVRGVLLVVLTPLLDFR